jgi:hypothetical protein
MEKQVKQSLLTLTKFFIGLCAIDPKSVLHSLFVNIFDSISEMRIKDTTFLNIWTQNPQFFMIISIARVYKS